MSRDEAEVVNHVYPPRLMEFPDLIDAVYVFFLNFRYLSDSTIFSAQHKDFTPWSETQAAQPIRMLRPMFFGLAFGGLI